MDTIRENITEVPLRSIDSIICDINSDDWMDDEGLKNELITGLIKDLTALLIRHDTDSASEGKGNDLDKVVNLVIDKLIKGTCGDLYLESIDIQIPGKKSKFAVAYSPSTKDAVLNAKANAIASEDDSKAYKLSSNSIEIPGITMHVHVDTVPAMGELAGRTPYFDKNNGVIFGRGANDMLAQVASIPFILRKIRRNNSNIPICIIVTSGEEQNGKTDGSNKFFREISPEIIIEFEPLSARTTGVFSTNIAPYIKLETTSFSNVPDYNKICTILKKAIPTLQDLHFDIKFSDRRTVIIKFKKTYEHILTSQIQQIKQFFLEQLNRNLFEGEKLIRINNVPGTSSSLSNHKLDIFKKALAKYHLIEPAEFGQVSKSFREILEPRSVHPFPSFDTQSTMWLPVVRYSKGNILRTNWIICSINEWGEGRHAPNQEAAVIKQVVNHIYTISEFAKEYSTNREPLHEDEEG